MITRVVQMYDGGLAGTPCHDSITVKHDQLKRTATQSSLPIGTRALRRGHLSAAAQQKVGRSPCIAGRHNCTWLDGTSASTSLSSSSAPGSSEALALRLPADSLALALRYSAGT